ncbi:ABC transporter ATP-binding protein [Falsigemmobacter faecalis]|nr:ABC transporter ATP-binding protein [Falsigemmobacter faecalis]
MTQLLKVDALRTCFATPSGVFPAVDGASFSLPAGETLAIVGESGSGKSVTAMSILGLIPSPPGRVESGRILFKGHDLLSLTEPEMQRIRGNQISMIFQEPMTALNPVFTVGSQIREAILLHQTRDPAEARARAVEMLRLVGIADPDRRYDQFPHQLSGGMRQRVMIAMALSCNPDLLIADEPTTALDVTIQAQILELMRDLQRRFGTAVLLITHDLGVVAEMADQVIVMYAGRVVERAAVAELFDRPLHPYTVGLLRAMPVLNDRAGRLIPIEGTVPPPDRLPPGCRFAPRCAHVREICTRKDPALSDQGAGHEVACWLHLDYADMGNPS